MPSDDDEDLPPPERPRPRKAAGDKDSPVNESAEESLFHFLAEDAPKPEFGDESWRDELKSELAASVDDLKDIPDLDDESDPPEPPDLYTFYSELLGTRAKLMRGLQKNAQGVASALDVLKKLAVSHNSNQVPLSFCLALADLAEAAAESVEDPSTVAWHGHLDHLLVQAGLEKMEVVGMEFDPACMIAVRMVASKDIRPGLVVEEVRPGWKRGTEVVRPASVVISS